MSLDLTELKALEANATDAPWLSHIVTDIDHNEWPTFKLETIDGNALDYEHPERDASLIAYLRNNAPEIIRRLEAADRMAEALAKIVDKDTHLVWTGGAVKEPSHDEYGEFAEIAMEALAAYRKEGA